MEAALRKISDHYEALKAQASTVEEWRMYDSQQREAEAEVLRLTIDRALSSDQR